MKSRTGTLPNGMRYDILPSREPAAASVCVAYPAGSRYDPPAKEGLSHLVEHLSFDSVVDDYRTIGAAFNGVTTHDYNLYSARFGAGRVETVLELERRRMTQGEWPEKRLRPEVSVIASEAAEHSKVPSWFLSELVLRVAYSGHCYGKPVLGSPESLSNICADDLTRYRERYYRPAGAQLAITGPIDGACAEDLVHKVFADVKPSPAGRVPGDACLPAQGAGGAVCLHRRGGSSYFHFCYRTPHKCRGRVAVALLAGVAALGGTTPWSATDYWGGTFTSGLMQQGGFHRLSVQFQTMMEPGPVHVTGSIPASDPSGPAEERVFRGLADSSKITRRRLAAVKRQILLDWLEYSENPVLFARWLARSGVIGDGLGHDEWKSWLAALKPDDVEASIQDCLIASMLTRGWLYGTECLV